MNGWLVFLCVAAFLLLVLCIPVCVVVRYRTDSPVLAYLRWLFLKYDLTGQEKKPQAKKKKKKTPPEPAPAAADKKKSESPQMFADKLGVIVDLLASLTNQAAKVVRGFRIYKLELNMLVGGEDTAQTAISYGQINAAVYSVYGLADRFLNMAPPKITIRPSFTCEQSDIMFELRARMRPVVLLEFVVCAGVQFLIRIVRRGINEKQNRCAERIERAERVECAERAEREERAQQDIRADRAAREDIPDGAQRAAQPDREQRQDVSGQ